MEKSQPCLRVEVDDDQRNPDLAGQRINPCGATSNIRTTRFSFWAFDPRPMDNPPPNIGWWVGNSSFPVNCVEDAQAIWPRINQGTVFAFWRLPVPKFTSRLVNTTTTYNVIGTLVWDESGTGSCFKSIATGALGSNLLDTGKWLQVDIPYRLSNVMAEMVETMRLQSSGADGSSKLNDAEMQTWLDIEMAKENPRDGNGAPWAYDRRYRNQLPLLQRSLVNHE